MKEDWFIEKINGENFIYHCFSFDPVIQEHTYLGDEFIGMDHVEETRNLEAFDRVVEAGPFGFMPKLVKEIETIIGEGNFKYDGYEIGEDVFSLYFLIKKDVYESVLKKFEHWCKYQEIEDIVWWDNKLEK